MLSEYRSDSRDRHRGRRLPSDLGGEKVERLCTVYANDSRPLFIGWTEDKRPAFTDDVRNLSQQASRSFAESQRAGVRLRQVQIDNLVVAEYAGIQKSVYGNQKDIQSLLALKVKTQAGQEDIFSVNENSLLQSLPQSGISYQEIGDTEQDDIPSPTNSLYSVLFTPDQLQSDYSQVLMFSRIPDLGTNETHFTDFLRDSLQALISIELVVPEDKRKGYLPLAMDMASGSAPMPGPFGFLERANIVNFNPAWRRKLLNATELANKVNILNLSQSELEAVKRAQVGVSLHDMELDKLFELSGKMRDVAKKYFA